MGETIAEPWEISPGESRFVRAWIPAAPPSRILLFVHGLGDHSGRFSKPAQWLRDQGVAVYAYDHLGHGLSPGRRVCIRSYTALLDDMEAVLARLAARWPGVPLGMFGQSMGGNLVLNYLLRNRGNCLFAVAGSPMLRSEKAPGPVLNALARTLMMFVPNLRIPAPVDVRHLAQDPEVRQAFLDDNLVQRRTSLRLGAALIDSGDWALEHADRLPMRVLVLHVENDRITSPSASQAFADRSAGKVELIIHSGGLHDLHLDVGREAYWKQLLDWIRRDPEQG